MDPKPQQQQNEQENGGSAKGSFLCRQSSTRWTPTTEQIRILKDLYYNNGVRSPSAEQIQEISARLRQYGKIEGKNVFYWFQNYKARERQKKRFISTDVPMQRPEDSAHKYHNMASAGISAPSPSAANIYPVQQMGNYGSNAGSVTSEKSFRDFASGVDGSISQNLGWVGGIDPYTSSYTTTLFEMKNSVDDSVEEEAAPGIETLPLFPMHGEDNIKLNPSTYYSGSWYGSNDGNAISWASLELKLNSYTSRSN